MPAGIAREAPARGIVPSADPPRLTLETDPTRTHRHPHRHRAGVGDVGPVAVVRRGCARGLRARCAGPARPRRRRRGAALTGALSCGDGVTLPAGAMVVIALVDSLRRGRATLHDCRSDSFRRRRTESPLRYALDVRRRRASIRDLRYGVSARIEHEGKSMCRSPACADDLDPAQLADLGRSRAGAGAVIASPRRRTPVDVAAPANCVRRAGSRCVGDASPASRATGALT